MRTVRLTKEQEEKLTAIARQKQVSRSQIIKEALEQYMEQETSLNNPYNIGASLFGRHGSGESDRSVTYKERLSKKLRKKWRG